MNMHTAKFPEISRCITWTLYIRVDGHQVVVLDLLIAFQKLQIILIETSSKFTTLETRCRPLLREGQYLPYILSSMATALVRVSVECYSSQPATTKALGKNPDFICV